MSLSFDLRSKIKEDMCVFISFKCMGNRARESELIRAPTWRAWEWGDQPWKRPLSSSKLCVRLLKLAFELCLVLLQVALELLLELLQVTLELTEGQGHRDCALDRSMSSFNCYAAELEVVLCKNSGVPIRKVRWPLEGLFIILCVPTHAYIGGALRPNPLEFVETQLRAKM